MASLWLWSLPFSSTEAVGLGGGGAPLTPPPERSLLPRGLSVSCTASSRGSFNAIVPRPYNWGN